MFSFSLCKSYFIDLLLYCHKYWLIFQPICFSLFFVLFSLFKSYSLSLLSRRFVFAGLFTHLFCRLECVLRSILLFDLSWFCIKIKLWWEISVCVRGNETTVVLRLNTALQYRSCKSLNFLSNNKTWEKFLGEPSIMKLEQFFLKFQFVKSNLPIMASRFVQEKFSPQAIWELN